MAATISLAMIVRDESANLAECIESVRAIIDELCVVDTGSKDGTLEIAHRLGAKTGVFLWCDDFAAARNESLRMCTRDWVFVLDADERIAKEDLQRLRSLVRGPREACYRFTTRNYTNTTNLSDFQPCERNDPHCRGFAGWYPSTKVRLFPNRPDVKFDGRVHELVNTSLERAGVRVFDSDIPIHHYALLKSAERLRQKQAMYLQLGHQKAIEDPKDPKALWELGNQYMEVGDYPQAVACYRESLKLEPSNPMVWKDLGGALFLFKRNDEAKRAIRIGLDLDPEMADGWRNLGVVYSDEKEWENAVECFRRGMKLRGEWLEGHRYLSTALEGAGRYDEAVAESRKALEANACSKEALKLFVHQMLRLERRREARETLLQIAGANPAQADIRNAIGELCFYDNLFDDAKAQFEEAGKLGLPAAYNNLGVVFFKERDFPKAREAFEKCLAFDPGHRGARNNLAKVLSHTGDPHEPAS